MEEVNWTVAGLSFLAMSAAIYALMEGLTASAKKFGFNESSVFARVQPIVPMAMGVPMFVYVGPQVMEPVQLSWVVYACFGALGGNLSSNAYGIWKQSIKGADERIQKKLATIGEDDDATPKPNGVQPTELAEDSSPLDLEEIVSDALGEDEVEEEEPT